MKKASLVGLAILFAVSFAACKPVPPATPSTPPIESLPPVVSTPPATESILPPDPVTPGVSESPTITGIPDFKEGTTVAETDVAELVTAFKAKYPSHTISGIKHALFENEQVYAIDYTDSAGKADVAYYRPSGTWVEMETVSPAPAG
jgi:hypothetical protein